MKKIRLIASSILVFITLITISFTFVTYVNNSSPVSKELTCIFDCTIESLYIPFIITSSLTIVLLFINIFIQNFVLEIFGDLFCLASIPLSIAASSIGHHFFVLFLILGIVKCLIILFIFFAMLAKYINKINFIFNYINENNIPDNMQNKK